MANLRTRTARLGLKARGKPHRTSLGLGLTLGYRKPQAGAGSWVVFGALGNGREWVETFATADDLQEADGVAVLDYGQADTRARELAKGRGSAGAITQPLATVAAALAAYEAHLVVESHNPDNSRRVMRLLAGSALLARPVAQLTVAELKAFRDGLVGPGRKPQSVNRDLKGLRAALALAAKSDPRVLNSNAWRFGLEALRERDRENRNVTLPDDQISAIVAAARAQGDAFGDLVEMLAVTGARISQVIRLTVADLLHNMPAIMVPVSRKGNSKTEKPCTHHRRALAPAFAARLRAVSAGRAPGAPLLVRTDGKPWTDDIAEPFRRAVIAAKLDRDPATVTPYALRHSSIGRMLGQGYATKIVAEKHDTSIVMIERNYTRNIADHADERLARDVLDVTPALAAVA